ncbi:MAG: ArnT family glycosyltransferase [Candidatus Puniceispirillaceae bacterium]
MLRNLFKKQNLPLGLGISLSDLGQLVSAAMRQKGALWLVVVLLAGLVMVGHQSLAPIDRDEARFAQASKQMVLSGDFITIRFQDEYRAKKPAGIYWLQATSASLFGIDAIENYRLPSLAGYLASFLMMIALARAMNLTGWGNLAPLIAGLFLSSGFIVFAESHLAKTDSVLLALILWQQWALWDIYKRRFDGQAGAAINQFWIAMAAGILIKGPIAPLVGFATLLGVNLFDKSLLLWARIRVVRGLFILAVLVAPWAISVQIATQGAFLDIAIKGDFLAKVQSGQESHGAPFGIYLLLLPLLAFPASLFAGNLAMVGKDIFQKDKGRFVIAWLLGYWLLIEATPTKLPHYVLPLLPALWLLVLMCFTTPAKAVRWRIITSYVITGFAAFSGLVFVIALGYLALRFGGTGSGLSFFFSLLSVMLVVGLLYLFWQWLAKPQSGLMIILLLMGALLHMIVISGVVSNAKRIHVSTALHDAVSDLSSQPSLVVAAGYHEPSMVFYQGQDILLVTAREAALLLAEAPQGLAIIEAAKRSEFLEVIEKLSLSVTEIDRVDGFNISKGRDVSLRLYRQTEK